MFQITFEYRITWEDCILFYSIKSASHHVNREDRHESSSVPVISDSPTVIDLTNNVVQRVPWYLILFEEGPSEDCSEMKGRGGRRVIEGMMNMKLSRLKRRENTQKKIQPCKQME